MIWSCVPGRDFKLAVQLVYERRRGADSHLCGYIAHLPQSFDLPVTWSDQELQDLQYPFLLDMVCAFLDLNDSWTSADV